MGISDPELGPLANNGGPTQTMALLPGSPAIGAGTAVSGVTTDQRGQPLDTPTPDVGAYQAQSSSSLTGLTFSGLSSPSIGFGTAGVTISGTLANGAQAPQGESLAITLNGVSQQATIAPAGRSPPASTRPNSLSPARPTPSVIPTPAIRPSAPPPIRAC